MPREPKEENLRLRSLLDEAGMSNKGLARRVVDLAAIQGLAGVRCDHTSVLRWLAGEQPRPPVPELVAVVLSNALGRKISETEMGMTPSNLPASGCLPQQGMPHPDDGDRAQDVTLGDHRRRLVNRHHCTSAVSSISGSLTRSAPCARYKSCG